MFVELDIKTDIGEALKTFHALEPRQFPFIVSLAMNRIVNRIKKHLEKEMPVAFDRPTPFTKNSLTIKVAQKTDLTANVRFRDFAGKGVPAYKYLNAEIEGGQRAYKSHERQLASAGLLPAGMYAVPAKGVSLNVYGNLPGPYINKIMSYLRTNRDATQNRGRGAMSRRNANGNKYGVKYWVRKVHAADGLPLGIYEVKGKTSRLVIAFVRSPSYTKRYRFHDLAQADARRYLGEELRKAADYAMATSRDAGFSSRDVIDLVNTIT